MFGPRLVSFVAFFVCLLAGCNVFASAGAGLDPAAAAFERASPRAINEERFYVRKPALDGALMVYQSFDGRFATYFGFGYMTQTDLGWQMREGGGGGRAGPPREDEPLYVSISSPETLADYTIVTGLVLDQRIEVVHVTFADGQIKMDAVADRLTGIIVKPKNAVCRIKLLDAQNKVLFDFELAKNPPGLAVGADVVEWAQKECL